MGLYIMESAWALSLPLVSNLLGAALPVAMSEAQPMFVLQAQN